MSHRARVPSIRFWQCSSVPVRSDLNSYSVIFWVLGRDDRLRASERPIFGSIRNRSSGSVQK